jgi:hypothetical protein
MRDRSAIQAAHDRLAAIIIGEVPNPFGKSKLAALRCACDALCWVLEHEHNEAFANNLKKIDAYLWAKGFELTDRAGRPFTS